MLPPKRIVVIAGEESGDLHAAAFIRELKTQYEHIEFSGIGGKHMQAAGVYLVSDLAKHGVTGLSEVIRHFQTIKTAFNQIKAHLIESKPDLLILVDYPGFNIRLAKYAKKVLGIKILYYISPQIWAWKAKRIHTLKEVVDKMAVILPFEKHIYEKAGIPVSFVGHPLVDKVKPCTDIQQTRVDLGLPKSKRIISMLPGSRTHEIERHMPVLAQCATNLSEEFTDLHFVIPVAGTIDSKQIVKYLENTPINYTLTYNAPISTVSCSDIAIVASGTASLECALLQKPMCIIYKASFLTYLVAMKVIKVRYLGLCNLLKNAMIVPELLQYDCNAPELTKMVSSFLYDKQICNRMTKHLKILTESLSSHAADCTISELIANEL